MFKSLIISGLCASAAFAQTSTTKLMAEHSGPVGISAALAGPASTIPGAPYSAQAVTQRVQTLPDGNRIVQTTTNAVARDSKGRVYREESMPGPALGATETPHLVLIQDPVANAHFSLDPTTKIAYKIPPSDQKKADEAAFSATHITLPDIQIVAAKSKLDDETAAVSTDLGTQTIEGLPAKGTKITRTLPAGAIGNDLPIVITTETWFSPDLKILLMSKSTDPRTGEFTYKLNNLVRTEPNPSLFQIPSDYTLKDQPNNLIFFKKLDK